MDINDSPLIYIRSVSTVNFLGALTTNSGAKEDIAFPNEIRQTNEVKVVSLSIISAQNLDWDVYLFRKAAFEGASIDADSYLGLITFAVSDGKQIGGAGDYYYSAGNLNIPYRDLDATSKLHVELVNRNATPKSANAAGAIVLIFGVRSVPFA